MTSIFTFYVRLLSVDPTKLYNIALRTNSSFKSCSTATLILFDGIPEEAGQ